MFLNFTTHPFEMFRWWVRREVRCVLAELGIIHPSNVDNPPEKFASPEPTKAPEAVLVPPGPEQMRIVDVGGGKGT